VSLQRVDVNGCVLLNWQVTDNGNTSTHSPVVGASQLSTHLNKSSDGKNCFVSLAGKHKHSRQAPV